MLLISFQDAEKDNILQRISENVGSNVMTKYTNEILNRWKREQVIVTSTYNFFFFNSLSFQLNYMYISACCYQQGQIDYLLISENF